MVKDITSPFMPGQPVPTEFFVGRIEEIKKLESKAAKACSGQIEVAFLSGERGIGKSSLAAFVRFLVERKQDMLGLHVFLGGVNNLEEMARSVFDQLLKETRETRWWDPLKGLFGNHIKGVGLFGVNVTFAPPKEYLLPLVQNFAQALRSVIDKLDDRKGILLVLDDVNGLASSAKFAHWLKSLVDEIATGRQHQRLPLCLIVVGLDERRQSLVSLQPSLARVFDLVEIKAWSPKETEDFFRETFEKVAINVEDDAMRLFVRYSGGLPVLTHEIGDAAFNLDDDGVINLTDAARAVTTAAEIVGRKHLQPQIFEVIRSVRYRSILRKLVRQQVGPEFHRSDVLAKLSRDEEKVFDNFIRRMIDLGAIVRDQERGAYRFANLLHYLYFYMEAEHAKQVKP